MQTNINPRLHKRKSAGKHIGQKVKPKLKMNMRNHQQTKSKQSVIRKGIGGRKTKTKNNIVILAETEIGQRIPIWEFKFETITNRTGWMHGFVRHSSPNTRKTWCSRNQIRELKPIDGQGNNQSINKHLRQRNRIWEAFMAQKHQTK